ncbi:unnamed protein product [Mycena citricolor]|uniref:Ammonium transporter AmtB-like domain-containing protein n=1 Tax=Mycena citricolor TaxID=2018698 RepID=A0AAD2K205_9AGAR|nr:unnamed protein product [Mycena citricolor]
MDYIEDITQVAVPAVDSGNTAWMIVATISVLLMTIPGIALFYGGLCLLIVGVISILWVAFGYSFVFGTSLCGTAAGSVIGGFDKVMLNGVTPSALTTGNIPEIIFVVFQCMFAVITPALILGAFAERIKFSGFMLFTILWSILVYNPMAHWVWGGGWLQEMGAIDFAGGTVVHINAGRRYRGQRFSGDALATCVAAMTWMLIDWVHNKKPTTVGVCTGAVAGLVAITPAAGTVSVLGAVCIGLLSSVVCFFMVAVVKPKFKYDDALDAFGVHAWAVSWVLFLPEFRYAVYQRRRRCVEGSALRRLASVVVQVVATAVSVVFSAAMTYILFKIVDKLVGLRVDARVEEEGLDIYEHGESAYNS